MSNSRIAQKIFLESRERKIEEAKKIISFAPLYVWFFERKRKIIKRN